MIDLVTLLQAPQMRYIIILIAGDVVLGIIAALIRKNFRLGRLANFMFKPVLGYIFGFAIIILISQALPSLAIIAQVSYILIILALIGSILNNVSRLGLKLPTYLKK
jgi:phage-related holin